MRQRDGTTMLEVTIAIGVLAIAMVMIAQLTTQSLDERLRTEERLGALEAANNILEMARAQNWRHLTAEWAAAQRLPEDFADRLLEPRCLVRVEPESAAPEVKRVTVEIGWRRRATDQPQSVSLSAVFANRTGSAKP